MGQIPARLAEIDPAATLFVVCQVGGRSQRVVAVPGPERLCAGQRRAAGWSRGRVRAVRWSPTTAASAPSEQHRPLGWSDDSGVFHVRNAVERARPPAGVVPALQRHAAGAVGSRSGPGVEADRGAWGRHRQVREDARRRDCRPGIAGSPCDRVPAPPPRRGRRPLGPTPRYAGHSALGTRQTASTTSTSSRRRHARARRLGMVRATLIATMAVFGVAALLHLVRYALLIINRSVLLNPWVAGAATWLGVGCQRHRDVHGGRQRSRVDELADRPPRRRIRLSGATGSATGVGAARGVPGARWSIWCGRRCSSSSSRASRSGSTCCAGPSWSGGWCGWPAPWCRCSRSRRASPRDAQGIANNTVTTTVAYLLALAALLLVDEGVPRVRAAARREAVKALGDRCRRARQAPRQQPEPEPENAAAVESEGQNPAA